MQEIDEAMVEGGNENCDHRMLVGEAQLPFHSVGLGERLDGGNILHADHHIDFETRYFFSRVEWEIAEFTISAGKIRVAEPTSNYPIVGRPGGLAPGRDDRSYRSRFGAPLRGQCDL